MEQWEYKSLEWIHKVREQDYNETRHLSPKELVEKTRKKTEDLARELELKVARTKSTSVS